MWSLYCHIHLPLSLDGYCHCLDMSLAHIKHRMHISCKMSLLVFENPLMFIEVVLKAGPEKNRFRFFVIVDIGMAFIVKTNYTD